MFGWIVQWYWNVPAVGKVWLNTAPGAIAPEFQTAPSDVDVCVIESLFVHVTVPPFAIVTGFGWYAVVSKVRAPATIEIEAFEVVLVVVVTGIIGDVL
jgi:hypothetical protein